MTYDDELWTSHFISVKIANITYLELIDFSIFISKITAKNMLSWDQKKTKQFAIKGLNKTHPLRIVKYTDILFGKMIKLWQN